MKLQIILLIALLASYSSSKSIGYCGCTDYEKTACDAATTSCKWNATSSKCEKIAVTAPACGDKTGDACVHLDNKNNFCHWDTVASPNACVAKNAVCTDLVKKECDPANSCFWQTKTTPNSCVAKACATAAAPADCDTGGSVFDTCKQNADKSACVVRTCITQDKPGCLGFYKENGDWQSCQKDGDACEDAGEMCTSIATQADCPTSTCKWDPACRALKCSDYDKTTCDGKWTCQWDAAATPKAVCVDFDGECANVKAGNEDRFCPANSACKKKSGASATGCAEEDCAYTTATDTTDALISSSCTTGNKNYCTVQSKKCAKCAPKTETTPGGGSNAIIYTLSVILVLLAFLF